MPSSPSIGESPTPTRKYEEDDALYDEIMPYQRKLAQKNEEFRQRMEDTESTDIDYDFEQDSSSAEYSYARTCKSI